MYYIGGGEGLCAILVRQNNANTLYYVHPDHLGSLAIITDANGGIQQKCTYDAWGKRTLVQGSLIFDRGFTGHEHLEEFALVNMNGRVYDPTLGRFLSPDPYVQNPFFSQSFNRYAYCYNNPLIFTDPDGEWAWLVIAGYFAITRAMKAGVEYSNAGRNFWEGFGKSFAVSAATIAVSYFAPFGTEVIDSMVWGTIGGAATGALNAWATGGDYKQNILVGAGVGAAFGFLSSEQARNMFKGKGFYNDNQVYENFKAGKYQIDAKFKDWHDAALDYFGFEGKYNPNVSSKNYQTSKGSYWGATNPTTGEISYGDLAFSDFKTLKATYYKESHTSLNIKYGRGVAKLPKDYQGLGVDTFLEEINGYMYAYRNQAFYLNSNFPFNGVRYYQSRLRSIEFYNFSDYPQSRFLNFLYKIPRRW